MLILKKMKIKNFRSFVDDEIVFNAIAEQLKKDVKEFVGKVKKFIDQKDGRRD